MISLKSFVTADILFLEREFLPWPVRIDLQTGGVLNDTLQTAEFAGLLGNRELIRDGQGNANLGKLADEASTGGGNILLHIFYQACRINFGIHHNAQVDAHS